MYSRWSTKLVVLGSVVLFLSSSICNAMESKRNALFIAVDDLRPDSIAVTGNHSHFRNKHPDVVTLPQHDDTGENIADGTPELMAKLSTQLVSEFGSLLVSTPEPVEKSETPVHGSDGSPVSFEKAKAGLFEQIETSIGTWKPNAGSTIIDDKHAKTGQQCLQLTGGEKTSVTLEVARSAETTGELTFWAERWTVREPFSFRIEKNCGQDWQEIYNGDKEIRVGRAFLSRVRVPLGDDSIQQLRFTVTSPPNTGILIDDMRMVVARPQKIVDVKVLPMTLPALVGTDASPLLKLKIETSGSLNPISLIELQGELIGIEAMESLHLSRSDHADGIPLAMPDSSSSASWKISPVVLSDGVNLITVNCKLKQSANVDRRVGAAVSNVTFSNGKTFKLDAVPSTQRLGVAVRKGGDDGVNTYRIPGLATTNKGTLIGVYDVRRRSGGDLPGDIDVGMSRSTDGGRTWEPMQVIMDMGNDPDWRYDGIGDPAVLVDQNTGTIWVAATWSHGNRSWRGSGPGLKPEETGQLMLARSDDDGVTWSKPINITKQIKKPEWCFILQGPGKGITMGNGTIVFAAQYQDPANESDKQAHRLPHSTIIYSKDHGKTWQVGTGAFDDTTESQVIEIEPGVLMLNCRYNRKSMRVVMTTRDMGQTWQQHPTSERSLIEPGSCMASLIDVDQEVGKDVGQWLLFSNPDSTRGRHHITIKASPDRGLTWPKEHRLLLDEGNSAGYSCMSMIDDKTVGILYEGSQAHMTFQRVPLNDLLGKVNTSMLPKLKTSPQSLKLPRVFGSHMVLQADAQVPIWGHAQAETPVTVILGERIFGDEFGPNHSFKPSFMWEIVSFRPLRYFEVSGDDGVFHPANAKIIHRNTITVSSSKVEIPINVRYAWLPFIEPPVNLFNSIHLPASPFSTEDGSARREMDRI